MLLLLLPLMIKCEAIIRLIEISHVSLIWLLAVNLLLIDMSSIIPPKLLLIRIAVACKSSHRLLIVRSSV